MNKFFTGRIVFLALLITGGIGGFGFAPTHLFLLTILSYGSLFYALQVNKSNGLLKTFFYGWVWAFAFFVSSLWWTGNALLVGGNPYAWALPLAVSGLPALLAFFTAFAALGFKILNDKFKLNAFRSATLFSVLLMTGEFMRAYCFTGFPWNMPAYIWDWNLPLLQSLSLSGPFFLALLTVLVSNYLTLPFLKDSTGHSFRPALSVMAVLVALTLWGTLRLSNAPVLSTHYTSDTYIRLVQPNIKQADKWNSSLYDNHISDITELMATPFSKDTLRAKNILIVAPETTLNEVMLSTANAKNELQELFTDLQKQPQNIMLYMGTMRSEIEGNERKFYNSSYLFQKDGTLIDIYDKFHLVPFGEYMPFADILPIEAVTKFKGMEFGDGLRTIKRQSFPSFSPLICYEILFPRQVILDNDRPDMLINITNDAWYGDAPGPYQHVQNAKYRSIEEGISTYRSANTGISIAADPYGRTIEKLELMERGVLDVPYIEPIPPTFYAKLGNTPYLIFSLILLVITFIKPKA